MSKQASFVSLSGINLNPSAEIPLHRQLYDALRDQILRGVLPSGSRLPPTRALAHELGVSRATTVEAYDQLTAEGYLTPKVGAGTFVSAEMPDITLRVEPPPATVPVSAEVRLSQRGQRLLALPNRNGRLPRSFAPGMPATADFPFDVWQRLLRHHWQTTPSAELGYGDSAGFLPLREAIVAHARLARGIVASAEQVIIVSGSQQAIDLAARLLLDAGDAAWLEDPGYAGARAALHGHGIEVVPVPIDDEGLSLSAGLAAEPAARLAYVTPSHQYPLGVTMSVARRLALLQWATDNQAWILEDDYDSEYRFAGHPLASLQGLDRHGRVLYVGTFSKVLFPALRLGYAIVPPALAEPFATARSHTDRGSDWVLQKALADFMAQGHFARHIRRMRLLYAERQAVLVEALTAGGLALSAESAGMHLVAWLPDGVDDGAISAELGRRGIDAQALSSYSMLPQPRGGLVLGYAAYDEVVIRKKAAVISAVVAAHANST